MNVRIASALWRTLLFQASWNYDRLVGVGMAHASEPLLRDLPGGRTGEPYREAMCRATEFFNAHPYMGGMAVGAVARAEHDGLPGEQVRRLRHALIGPLGSVGDRLFWAGVLPAAVGLGLVVTATVSPLAGIVSFLVAYNAVHLAIRVWGLRAGWRSGPAIAQELTAGSIQQGLRVVGPIAAIAVGFALPVVAEWLAEEFQMRTRLSIGLVAALAIVFSRWIVPTFGTLRFGLAAAGFALVVGWLS
ncbi:MAG: PTS system mannose/fructose/sorbose family transporter subunit IID [Gemmatimonadota bacterium]|nr:MAG: PTS system mannose/fructose/sorbose family transporter subunit IID [Gemmatimonadota bacterium]